MSLHEVAFKKYVKMTYFPDYNNQCGNLLLIPRNLAMVWCAEHWAGALCNILCIFIQAAEMSQKLAHIFFRTLGCKESSSRGSSNIIKATYTWFSEWLKSFTMPDQKMCYQTRVLSYSYPLDSLLFPYLFTWQLMRTASFLLKAASHSWKHY